MGKQRGWTLRAGHLLGLILVEKSGLDFVMWRFQPNFFDLPGKHESRCLSFARFCGSVRIDIIAVVVIVFRLQIRVLSWAW